MEKLFTEFLNPGAKYRGIPFWSWNGKLEKEELLRQIGVMKEMGFGGFFMHSRTGLETEYLGEEWFELINVCAEEAEKLGMEAWLYDEDRWPSGIAGGMVTENPEFRMRSIKLTVLEGVNGIEWEAGVIAAFSCRLEGVKVYEYQRIYADTPHEFVHGKQILVFSIIEMSKHSFYNGYTYVDTLNRRATEKFIELTHEQYKRRCGDKLGTSIKGIFTDEPHRGTLMDEFGTGNEEDIWRAPWTELLPQEFENLFGYDLLEKLPELFLKPGGKDVSQVKWHFVELVQQLFLNNFAKPVNEWCQKNNVILTGHILHEDSLAAQTAMSGSVMRYYEYMGYPGVDILTEQNRSYWVVKQLASAARQLGKTNLLSELYGCTGWQMNFESHKAIGDWQALFGINVRCPHLSWYTMEGEAKRDYPASILHQSTWWREYRHVEDYFSRVSLVLGQGLPCCDVLVLNPVESIWCQIHPGWAKNLGANTPEIMKLEKKYRDIFSWLSGAHIDFDYGDEEMISRYYSIEKDGDGTPLLKIGKADYRVVVIGGMLTIRSSTLDIVKKFMAAGGKVVVAGDIPDYADAMESNFPRELLSAAIKVPFKQESLIAPILASVKLRVEVTDRDGGNIDDIYCQVRDDGQNRYLMFLNINREKEYKDVKIKLNTSGNVEEWDCSSGGRFTVKNSELGNFVGFEADFEPGKEHIYIITPHIGTLHYKPEFTEIESFILSGPYAYKLDEPNVCVLDMAKFKIGNEEWQAEMEILKADQAIRKQFDLPLRGGDMLQPWFAKKHSFEGKDRIALEFEFFTDILPEGQLEIAVEKPEEFQILVNGQRINNIVTSGWWVDKCFKRIALPEGSICKGRNTIELSVNFHEGINLEALYLLGNFGVQLSGGRKTLVKLQDTLEAKDLTDQGLPFYSGKVRYAMSMPRKLEAGEGAYLEAEQFEAACVKVLSKDNREAIIAWKPYTADITESAAKDTQITIEAILTRRNTFGPLHQVTLRALSYGPYSFTTEGEDFTNDYMMLPSGLLKAPVVKIYKQ